MTKNILYYLVATLLVEDNEDYSENNDHHQEDHGIPYCIIQLVSKALGFFMEGCVQSVGGENGECLME